MATWAFAAVLLVAVFAYFASTRAAASLRQGGERLHSLPGYHGAFSAAWALLPAIILLLAWLAVEQTVLDSLTLAALPAEVTDVLAANEQSLLLNQIRQVAAGIVFGAPPDYVIAAAERLQRWQVIAGYLLLLGALSVAILGYLITRQRIHAAFRARQGVGHVLDGLMIFSALVAIATTIGIVLSLVFEAALFFDRVSIVEFLFGLRWEPQIAIREDQVTAGGAFGAVGVFAGTLLIAFIAMAVAMPIGLISAIYLSEYAAPGFRRTVKPVIEILAGIPTVVYGFFAVLIVAPFLSQAGHALGLAVAPNSALAAGAVMGIMIIPFISSLSEDALGAVPQAMRDGAYAVGATQSETITSILLPAALPGIVGGMLLAVSRAIGETMIVVMAAGLIANLTANPLEGVTTVTVQIVTLLIGDTEFDNPKTLAAFALGLVLFVSTLALNIVALRVVQKYRERYE